MSDECTAFDNPNSDEIPMVSPPLEITGLWNGTNCGLPSTLTNASLTMYENGTNIWYFDGVPQTGDGVEAVIGWECIGAGQGYWWGQTRASSNYWCNLFQVEYLEETRQATYINYAFGGQGEFANAAGSCPKVLTDIPSNALQATFTRTLDANETFQFTCQGAATTVEPSCRSQFQVNGEAVPDPFQDGNQSLPVLDQTSCLPINAPTSSSSVLCPILPSLLFLVLLLV